MHALTELFYQKHALPTTRLKGNCCKVPSVLSVCLHALNQVTHGNKVMQVIREHVAWKTATFCKAVFTLKQVNIQIYPIPMTLFHLWWKISVGSSLQYEPTLLYGHNDIKSKRQQLLEGKFVHIEFTTCTIQINATNSRTLRDTGMLSGVNVWNCESVKEDRPAEWIFTG